MNKIGILHLTDIHFRPNLKDVYLDRCNLLFKAVKDDFLECKKLYIVVSGDIAYSGKKEEYGIAHSFFKKLFSKLKERYDKIEIHPIFVPGNHDCNFDYNDQLRKNTILNIDSDTVGSDSSVVKKCIEVQRDFWEFFCQFNQNQEQPKNFLYYTKIDTVGSKKICFHCLNTAWMSQKNEEAGSLFFPVDCVNKDNEEDYDLNIAVYHHPVNWFNPSKGNNNKKELQQLVEEISLLQFVGHEHSLELKKNENIFNEESDYYFSGELFYNEENSTSGFQTFIVDLDAYYMTIYTYSWKEKFFKRTSEKDINIGKSNKNNLNINLEFCEKINSMKMPLALHNTDQNLSDIFIYPDLEPINIDSEFDKIDDYISAERLLECNDANFIIDGECQAGKSSLLYMYFIEFKKRGYYPLIIKGEDLVTDNIDRIINTAFNKQYRDDEYEQFRQLDKNKKILLIDDLHSSSINWERKGIFVKQAIEIFCKTIITVNMEYSRLPQFQSYFRNHYRCSNCFRKSQA